MPDANRIISSLYDNTITESDVISANNFSGHYGQGAVLFGNPSNYNKHTPLPFDERVITSAKYTVLGKGSIPSEGFDSIDANGNVDNLMNNFNPDDPYVYMPIKVDSPESQSTSLGDNELLLFATDVQSGPFPFTSSLRYSHYDEDMTKTGNAFDFDGGQSTLALWFRYDFPTLDNFSQSELNSVDKTKLEGVCSTANEYFGGENCRQNGLDISKNEYQFFPLSYGDIGDPGSTYYRPQDHYDAPYYHTGNGEGKYFDTSGSYADYETWKKHHPNVDITGEFGGIDSEDSHYVSAQGCKYDLFFFIYREQFDGALCSNGSTHGYWLRSPYSAFSSNAWAVTDIQGQPSSSKVDDFAHNGARSAFKLDRNSVLFTSQFGEYGYANELTPRDENSGYDTAEDQDYKLTLISKQLQTPKITGHSDGDIFSLPIQSELRLDMDKSSSEDSANNVQTRDASSVSANELAVKVINHATNEVVSYQKSKDLDHLNIPLSYNYNTMTRSPLQSGVYDVYVWNQVDHYNNSDEGSIPVRLQVYINGTLPNTGIIVSWMLVCLVLLLVSLAFSLKLSLRRNIK